MFQFSAGAMITNFFSSGAILFTLLAVDGTAAVPTSIGACIAVMFIMKIVGANLLQSGFTKWCLMEVVLRKLGAKAG